MQKKKWFQFLLRGLLTIYSFYVTRKSVIQFSPHVYYTLSNNSYVFMDVATCIREKAQLYRSAPVQLLPIKKFSRNKWMCLLVYRHLLKMTLQHISEYVFIILIVQFNFVTSIMHNKNSLLLFSCCKEYTVSIKALYYPTDAQIYNS